MNILLYIEHLSIGGQQTYSYNVLKHLKHKHNIFIAYVVDGDFRLKMQEITNAELIKVGNNDCTTRFILRNPFKVIRTIFSIREICISNKIDAIITNGSFTYFTGAIGAKLAKTKVARFVGGDLFKNEKLLFVNLFNLIPLHKITDKFFAYEYMYSAYLKKGVAAQKLALNYNANGVDTSIFHPIDEAKKSNMRTILNIKNNDFVIGWVGRLSPEMEIVYTIEMIGKLKKLKFTNFKFLVVGDGIFKDEIIKRIRLHEFIDDTIFIGFVDQSELKNYYGIMDVAPLLDQDPHGGNFAREAMACGTIVLTVNGKSNTQGSWIKNNFSGFLIESNDFINEAANKVIYIKNASKNELIKISKNGIEYANNNMSYIRLSEILMEHLNEKN